MSRGLGDTLKWFTRVTGIAAIVGPCAGCDQRQERLNSLFPYQEQRNMIKPTKETVIPNGPEQLGYQYVSDFKVGPAGVKQTLAIQLHRYRADAEGNAMTTGPTIQIPLIGLPLVPPGQKPEPEAEAKVKAAIDRYNASNEAAIQQLVADLGV